jgi:hypothetical protein
MHMHESTSVLLLLTVTLLQLATNRYQIEGSNN